jgi:regulator of protease activity HflC (stomatin/prohibitin superfamily)
MAEATRSLSPHQITQRLLKHRAAVATLAQQAARKAVKERLRADGLKLHDFSAKEISALADKYLAEHRARLETAVQEIMQKTPDDYGAGVIVQQVQLQKVDPPMQLIDAFRDVQAARSDLERAQNEAQTYANRVVPEARGRAAKVIQDAEAHREQTV